MGGPKERTSMEAQSQASYVTIIHFNDCYNVEPGAKSSGAAGFLTAVNQFRHLNPMILFSGDIISPSFMSTFTKGEQMIPVLNDIGVHCAVFGNHEFDYGVDNLIEFTKRTTFPWLLSNVVDKETSRQLGEGQVFHVLERAGLKFGLIGLIEEEWLSTLSTLDSEDVIYQDFVSRGRELAAWLKGPPHSVDFVIALTHFRTPNDVRLADSVPDIDLILGGHDHDYEVIERPTCHIIKSGTDFREFSLIKLRLVETGRAPSAGRRRAPPNGLRTECASGDGQLEEARCRASAGKGPFVGVDIERVDCAGFAPELSLKCKLDKFVTSIDEKMGQVLGQFNCELDGRFSSIRKNETNLGNFVTDIMLASTHADLAILNSGTLRSDRVHPRGDFTMRDLFNILGYIDPIAVLQASGRHIWRALENGVSQWPKLEGRFPQVSGCSFQFDPSKPPMSRIDPNDITIGDEPLDLDKDYKLTTKAYLASGKDGYDVLKECKVLVPGDESPDLTTSILNHFEAISIIKSKRRTHHRQSIICLSRASIKRILDQTQTGGDQSLSEQADERAAGERAAGTVAGADTTHLVDANDNNNNNNGSANNNDNNNAPLQNPTKHASSAYKLRALDSDHDGADISGVGKFDDAMGALRSNNRHHNIVELNHTPTLTNVPPNLNHLATGAPVAVLVPDATPPLMNQKRTKRMMSLYEMEHEQCKLEPKVEGRIKILGVSL